MQAAVGQLSLRGIGWTALWVWAKALTTDHRQVSLSTSPGPFLHNLAFFLLRSEEHCYSPPLNYFSSLFPVYLLKLSFFLLLLVDFIPFLALFLFRYFSIKKLVNASSWTFNNFECYGQFFIFTLEVVVISHCQIHFSLFFCPARLFVRPSACLPPHRQHAGSKFHSLVFLSAPFPFFLPLVLKGACSL